MLRKTKIRFIAIGFVCVAVGIGGVIFAPFLSISDVFSPRKTLKQSGVNVFSDVRAVMYDAQDRKIDISANQLSEEKKDYHLKRIQSSFTVAGEQWQVMADNAQTKTYNFLDFSGNVQLKSALGTLKTEHAEVDIKKQIVYGNNSIEIFKDNAKLSGERYSVDLGSKHASISGNIKGTQNDRNISGNQLDLYWNSDKTLKEIEVRKAIYNDAKYVASAEVANYSNDILYAKGAVNIATKNEKITTDDLVCRIKNGEISYAEFSGRVKYFSPKFVLQSSKIIYEDDEINASGNVVLDYKKMRRKYKITTAVMSAKLCNGIASELQANRLTIKSDDIIIRADSGKMRNNRLYLKGNVSASGDMGNIFGDAAELDLATGEVFVKHSGGIVGKDTPNGK